MILDGLPADGLKCWGYKYELMLCHVSLRITLSPILDVGMLLG